MTYYLLPVDPIALKELAVEFEKREKEVKFSLFKKKAVLCPWCDSPMKFIPVPARLTETWENAHHCCYSCGLHGSCGMSISQYKVWQEPAMLIGYEGAD